MLTEKQKQAKLPLKKKTDHVQELFGSDLLCHTEHREGLRTRSSVHRHPVLLGCMLLLGAEQLTENPMSSSRSILVINMMNLHLFYCRLTNILTVDYDFVLKLP